MTFIDHKTVPAGLLPYWRRGLLVPVIAVSSALVFGAIALTLLDILLGAVLDGRLPSGAAILGDLVTGLHLSSFVGAPMAIVAGIVTGLVVARRGTIGAGTTVLIAFVVPWVLGIPLIASGLFTFLIPFLSLVAIGAAFLTRAGGIFVCKRLFGMRFPELRKNFA